LNALNHEGYAPIHLAVLSESVEILRELLYNGRNLKINIPDKRAGFTALHYAAMRSKLTPLCNLLVKNEDIDLNFRSYNGCTPLHVAVANKNYLITMCLVRYEADLNAQSDIPVHTDWDLFQMTQRKFTLLRKCVDIIFEDSKKSITTTTTPNALKVEKVNADSNSSVDSPSQDEKTNLNDFTKTSKEVKKLYDAELEKEKYDDENSKGKFVPNQHNYDVLYYAQNDPWVLIFI
jgi:hypothetical protein